MNEDTFIHQILRNSHVQSAFWGWAVAQSLKVFFGVIRERRFNFRWFVGSGGMPSSHAALVMAASTSIGLTEGFGTSLYALSLVFAFITMFDAQGVRRQVGSQAAALNRICEDIYEHRGIQEEPVAQLLGHTPIQVFAGALIGILAANTVIR